MNVIAYLGQGIAHERMGIPCQDAVRYCVKENDTVIMALSDGAGSAESAEEAAKLTVESTLDFFLSMPLSDFLQLDESRQKIGILTAIRNAFQKSPAYVPGNEAAFSATLLFAVADAERILSGHLGDGAIYAADKAGSLLFQSEPENCGENSTYFVVSPEAERHLRLELRNADEISGLILLSDGPYTMFRNRGGKAEATAMELLTYARDGYIRHAGQLADVLNQMAEIPVERLDDWSILLFDRNQEASTEKTEIISMLKEEMEKYALTQPEQSTDTEQSISEISEITEQSTPGKDVQTENA